MFFFWSIIIFLSIFIYYKLPKKYQIYSIPNNRSSHSENKISSAGIPIIIVFLFFYFFNNQTLNLISIFFMINIFLILFYGYLDDKISLAQNLKLVIQCYLALSIVLYIHLLGYKLNVLITLSVFLFAIFFFNLINFIDGADGNLSLNLLLISCNLVLYFYFSDYSYLLIFIIISSIVFLFFFNFPPSKMFLGETGSAFFSYIMLFSLMMIFFENRDNFFSLLILYSFIFSDVLITLGYRVFKYKFDASKGHKTHLYQLIAAKFGHKTNLKYIFLYTFLFITPMFHLSMIYDSQLIKLTLYFISIIPSIFLVLKFGIFKKQLK